MNVRQIAAIIPLICLVGCASFDTDRDFERALKAHWSKVSESDFPLPATTPYDTDTNLREQYLKGYADGVRERLRQFRAGIWECGDRLPPPAPDRPYIDGTRDGSLAVLARSGAIVEAVTTEQQKKESQQGGPAYPPQGVGSADP